MELYHALGGEGATRDTPELLNAFLSRADRRNLLHARIMNLQCRSEIASAYQSGSQVARSVSEDWCARELYCPACDSDRLSPSTANTPAFDFACPLCAQLFQLKSSRSWNLKKVVDAGYEAMMRAIRADKTPNLLLLQYSPKWFVTNLLLVPRAFLTENVIEKRRPLSCQARRAGWVGCNILLRQIPDDGKIAIVSAGAAIPVRNVRAEFSRVRRLGELPRSLRGWTVDILRSRGASRRTRSSRARSTS